MDSISTFIDKRLKNDRSYKKDLIDKALKNGLDTAQKLPDCYVQIESGLWFTGVEIPKGFQDLYLIHSKGKTDLVEIKRKEEDGLIEIFHLLDPKKRKETRTGINLGYCPRVSVPGSELLKPESPSILDLFKKV